MQPPLVLSVCNGQGARALATRGGHGEEGPAAPAGARALRGRGQGSVLSPGALPPRRCAQGPTCEGPCGDQAAPERFRSVPSSSGRRGPGPHWPCGEPRRWLRQGRAGGGRARRPPKYARRGWPRPPGLCGESRLTRTGLIPGHPPLASPPSGSRDPGGNFAAVPAITPGPRREALGGAPAAVRLEPVIA